jgi:inosose dehydratase
MNAIAVANAPCSYGAFEVTVGILDGVPSGLDVLDHVAASGYDGIDLGPVGYLAAPDELAERLGERGLSLAGGFVGLPFSEPDRCRAAFGEVDAVIDILDRVCGDGLAGRPAPRPTLVDAGSPARVANPGRAAKDTSLGLDEDGWKRFADGLQEVAARFRERGHEPTFHPHTATYVEAVWEIERFLELTDVGMCVDTGHVVVGGGEPAECIRRWSDRINHIHVKDVDRTRVASIIEERLPVQEIWRRRAFPALGTGDLDLNAVVEAIKDIGYSGWVVVEQDIFPEPAGFEQTLRDQAANRAFLADRGV